MATGEYNSQGSSWTGKKSRKGNSAVVASGVVKGAKFILKGRKGKGK